MKAMKNTVLRSSDWIISLDQHFHEFFNLNTYEAEHFNGDVAGVLSVELSQLLRKRRISCRMYGSVAFDRLRNAILFELPQQLTEDNPQAINPESIANNNNNKGRRV